MSNPSVALVAVERVVVQVRRHVNVDDNLARKLSVRRKISIETAKEQLLFDAVKVALEYSKGDEKKAGMAMIITDGRINRIPQCAKLLRRYDSKIVRVAYEVKETLSVSMVSLRNLCELVRNSDGDPEGEASRIQVVMDELASRELTRKQKFFFYRRVREEVKAGRLIEAVVGEILDELDRREEANLKEGVARAEIYDRVYQK